MKTLARAFAFLLMSLSGPLALAGSDGGTLTAPNGKCLVAESNTNGGNILVFDCFHRSAANPDARPAGFFTQAWSFDDQGRVVAGGGKCLDVEARDFDVNGAKVQLWDCHNEPNQKWTLSGGRLRLRGTDKCLEVVEAEAAQNGGHVRLWACAVQSNQVWNFPAQAFRKWCGPHPGGLASTLTCVANSTCKQVCRRIPNPHGHSRLVCSGPKICVPTN